MPTTRCPRTKPGWYCTRNVGHKGPCCPAPRWWKVVLSWRWWYDGRGDYSFGAPGEWLIITTVILAIFGFLSILWPLLRALLLLLSAWIIWGLG